MSFAAKPDGGMRLVADLVHLNKHGKRLIHLFMSLKDIINQSESDAKYFATLDAKTGYWQLELDKESQKYTCFITEWGLYRYCRAPMGLVSSSDIFCQRRDAALAGIPGMQKPVGNIVVVGKSKKIYEIYQNFDFQLREAKVTNLKYSMDLQRFDQFDLIWSNYSFFLSSHTSFGLSILQTMLLRSFFSHF